MTSPNRRRRLKALPDMIANPERSYGSGRRLLAFVLCRLVSPPTESSEPDQPVLDWRQLFMSSMMAPSQAVFKRRNPLRRSHLMEDCTAA